VRWWVFYWISWRLQCLSPTVYVGAGISWPFVWAFFIRSVWWKDYSASVNERDSRVLVFWDRVGAVVVIYLLR